jgi:pyridoxine 5-phosphate synthase
MKLGVNVDHIAVLKAARRIGEPDTLQAVYVAAQNGADQITIHLREDRRHIDDYDAVRIVQNSPLPVNVECGFDCVKEVASLAPHRATLVPEKREEVTTEGGLDVDGGFSRIKDAAETLRKSEVKVSLFIEPSIKAVELSLKAGVDCVEFHTGRFANIYAMLNSNLSRTPYSVKPFELSRTALATELREELKKLCESALYAKNEGLMVAAGHGLNYQNVRNIVEIEAIDELNIGQSIVARSIWVGLAKAVREMRRLIG